MSPQLLGALAAAGAGTGGYLMWTAAPRPVGRTPGELRRAWLARAGLGDTRLSELAGAGAVLAAAGAVGAYAAFGGVLPALVGGALAAALPLGSVRARRRARLAAAAEAWPRLLEEVRMRTGSLGRSVPQALFEAGKRAPPDWLPALAAAEREWLLTTDFPRTAALLKQRLADATADVVCETLEVAHELGGPGLEARLAELVEDRVLELEGRKNALSRQAGVRFARRFVLLVPLGMALAGLSIGTGRAAYASAGGQVAVAVGLLCIAACWVWSGRLMRLPAEPRVFQ